MDAQSIITQASRDEDNASSASCLDKVPETKNSHRSSSLLSRLFCCFRPPITQSISCTPPSTQEEEARRQRVQAHTNYLLKPVSEKYKDKKCVVIDLDETLVHSSFQPVKNADFIIPVEIDGTIHQVYVLKRPYVEEFLRKMGEMFECVLFTASLGKYADPVTDLLDKWSVFQSRLFRESCVFHKGNYVKDLSRLGRDLDKIVIVDNSPMSYLFHPRNAVPVVSWFDDPTDRELLDLIPFFEELSKVEDIYTFLANSRLPLGLNTSRRLAESYASLPQSFHPSAGIPALNATFSPPPMPPLVRENSLPATRQENAQTFEDQSGRSNHQNDVRLQQFTSHQSLVLRVPNTLPRPHPSTLQTQQNRSSLQQQINTRQILTNHLMPSQRQSSGSNSSVHAANHH